MDDNFTGTEIRCLPYTETVMRLTHYFDLIDGALFVRVLVLYRTPRLAHELLRPQLSQPLLYSTILVSHRDILSTAL